MYRDSVLNWDGHRMVANESLTTQLFVLEFKRSHGMQGARRSKNKGQKGFPNYFHKPRVYVWDSVMCELKVWLNFSPNRMDPDFAKRLFRRTRDSWCKSSHNYFPSWNIANLEQPGKQQKEDSLNSVDWPEAFYKEPGNFSVFLVTHGGHAAEQEQQASQCTELVQLHGTHWLVHVSRSCCRPVISTWLALKIRASDRGEHPREVRSSCIVGSASVAPRQEYQHFLGGIGQENVQEMFSFSDMLFTKHWKQIPK